MHSREPIPAFPVGPHTYMHPLRSCLHLITVSWKPLSATCLCPFCAGPATHDTPAIYQASREMPPLPASICIP